MDIHITPSFGGSFQVVYECNDNLVMLYDKIRRHVEIEFEFPEDFEVCDLSMDSVVYIRLDEKHYHLLEFERLSKEEDPEKISETVDALILSGANVGMGRKLMNQVIREGREDEAVRLAEAGQLGFSIESAFDKNMLRLLKLTARSSPSLMFMVLDCCMLNKRRSAFDYIIEGDDSWMKPIESLLFTSRPSVVYFLDKYCLAGGLFEDLGSAGVTLLNYYIIHSNYEAIEYLLARGARTDRPSLKYKDSLHCAVYSSQNCARILMRHLNIFFNRVETKMEIYKKHYLLP